MKRELVPLNQRPGTFNNAMSPEKRGPASSKEPARVMRELRLKALTTLRAEMGWTSLPEYPRVCGVVMDWPLQGDVVTAVALRGGDASIYTTGTFGVLGGIGHARIRQAAVAWLQCAEKLFVRGDPWSWKLLRIVCPRPAAYFRNSNGRGEVTPYLNNGYWYPWTRKCRPSFIAF